MRDKEEIWRIVEGFAKSGMTRGAYCAQHDIAVATLDYWRRAYKKQKPKLVPIMLEEARLPAGFALVLANGRRIESSWSFAEADLEKLIRAAEA